MSNNPQKRDLVNRALMILNAGRTSDASVLFASIDDTEFANWTTVAVADADKRLACFCYDRILKEVLLDIQPEFACDYADLGQWRKVNKADGGWDYLFELPDDFLGLVYQCEEGNPTKPATLDRDPEVLLLCGYSHTVVGTDDLVYYCDTNHTSVDDAADGQPPDHDGDGNWTLDATEKLEGADWAAGVAYQYNRTAFLLGTNTFTNEDADSAYIKYIAYVQAGRSDQPAYYPESFKNAFATRLAAEMALDSKDYERRRMLLDEYERLAKPQYQMVQNRHKDRLKTKTAFAARLG